MAAELDFPIVGDEIEEGFQRGRIDSSKGVRGYLGMESDPKVGEMRPELPRLLPSPVASL